MELRTLRLSPEHPPDAGVFVIQDEEEQNSPCEISKLRFRNWDAESLIFEYEGEAVRLDTEEVELEDDNEIESEDSEEVELDDSDDERRPIQYFVEQAPLEVFLDAPPRHEHLPGAIHLAVGSFALALVLGGCGFLVYAIQHGLDQTAWLSVLLWFGLGLAAAWLLWITIGWSLRQLTPIVSSWQGCHLSRPELERWIWLRKLGRMIRDEPEEFADGRFFNDGTEDLFRLHASLPRLHPLGPVWEQTAERMQSPVFHGAPRGWTRTLLRAFVGFPLAAAFTYALYAGIEYGIPERMEYLRDLAERAAIILSLVLFYFVARHGWKVRSFVFDRDQLRIWCRGRIESGAYAETWTAEKGGLRIVDTLPVLPWDATSTTASLDELLRTQMPLAAAGSVSLGSARNKHRLAWERSGDLIRWSVDGRQLLNPPQIRCTGSNRQRRLELSWTGSPPYSIPLTQPGALALWRAALVSERPTLGLPFTEN